jgi:excisionase family DNA binding protein
MDNELEAKSSGSALPAELLAPSGRSEAATDELLSTEALAKRLGVSRQTIDRMRREGEIQAFRNPNGRGYVYKQTTTIEVGMPGRRRPAAADREALAGERDAAVVALLLKGDSTADVCVATMTPIESVVRIRAALIAARKAEEQAPLVVFCQSCHHAPGNVNYSTCPECWSKITLEQNELRKLRQENEQLRAELAQQRQGQ